MYFDSCRNSNTFVAVFLNVEFLLFSYEAAYQNSATLKFELELSKYNDAAKFFYSGMKFERGLLEEIRSE